jgi:hypothetical protein
MATTVRDLIAQLQEIKDKDQAVIFQYFLADHFSFDTLKTPTPEEFDQVAENLDDASLWDDAAETISDYLFGIVGNREDN